MAENNAGAGDDELRSQASSVQGAVDFDDDGKITIVQVGEKAREYNKPAENGRN